MSATNSEPTASTTITLVDIEIDEELSEEIECMDSDTDKLDVLHKIMTMLNDQGKTMQQQSSDIKGILQHMQSQHTDITDIKKILRILGANVNVIQQAQVSEAGRLTNLEVQCSRRAATNCTTTPLPFTFEGSSTFSEDESSTFSEKKNKAGNGDASSVTVPSSSET